MNIDSIQEQRAKNIIWNAAGDYRFVPDYAAYEKDGEPSLYFNCIIGSVHRYYNYAPIHDMLLRLGRLREANLFRGLVWLGLERCTYEHALTDRPLLTTLRTSYSQTVWDQRTSYWDQELFDRLNTAHFGAVIGHHSRLSKKEQALLADLEFDSTLTSEQIVEHMNHLMELYFHCSIPPLHDKRRFPVFPVRFRKAALHGGALITTMQNSGDTEQKKQLTLWLPALRAETRNQKLRQFLEDSFGLSLYAPEDLEKLEKKTMLRRTPILSSPCHPWRIPAFFLRRQRCTHFPLCRTSAGEEKYSLSPDKSVPPHAQHFPAYRPHPQCATV